MILKLIALFLIAYWLFSGGVQLWFMITVWNHADISHEAIHILRTMNPVQELAFAPFLWRGSLADIRAIRSEVRRSDVFREQLKARLMAKHRELYGDKDKDK